jgi:hypothetical protein
MSTGADWPEVGSDALDPARPARGVAWPWLPRRRPALGVRPTVASPLLFIVCGVILGPQGLNLLSLAVVDRLEIVVSVALAILGVFVGLGTAGIPRDAAAEALRGTAVGSTVTIAVVGTGMGLLLRSWGVQLPMSAFAFAAIVGICASASAAVHFEEAPDIRRATYLADLDDVPLVLLGTLAIALLAGGSMPLTMLRLALTIGAGAAVGFAGWLLFDRAEGLAERGVFVTGAVLLLAGIGAYLGTSPLLSGLTAALVWVRAPGAADRITAADLRVLQHPLVSLLLIVAGALIAWSPAVLWIASALVLLRLTAKLAASLAVAPMLRLPAGLIATVLLPPGVLGVALALNVRQVQGDDAAGIVAVVTAAAACAELLAIFLPRNLEDAR